MELHTGVDLHRLMLRSILMKDLPDLEWRQTVSLLNPQLDERALQQIEAAIFHPTEKRSVLIATPPVFIDGRYQVVEFGHLQSGFGFRLPSGVRLQTEDDAHSQPVVHFGFHEALHHAREYWPERLAPLSDYAEVFSIRLLPADGEGKPEMGIWVATRRTLDQLKGDTSDPTGVLLDQETIFGSCDLLDAREIGSGLTPIIVNICANCGEEIPPEERCYRCNRGETIVVDHFALPPNLVNFATLAGNEFGVSPHIAQDAERERFERN